MKRLIDAIIAKWFTVPEWELEREIHKHHVNLIGEMNERPYRTTLLYRCKKTGKFKIVEL